MIFLIDFAKYQRTNNVNKCEDLRHIAFSNYANNVNITKALKYANLSYISN